MGETFNNIFKLDNMESDIAWLNEHISLKASDVVKNRKKLFESDVISSYESTSSSQKMDDFFGDLFDYGTRLSFLYAEELSHIKISCDILQYKDTCMYLYEANTHFNSKASEMKKIYENIQSLILREIKMNPYISYIDLVQKDVSSDIDVVLEHMIETNKVQCINLSKPTKYGKTKWIVK